VHSSLETALVGAARLKMAVWLLLMLYVV